MTEIRKINLWNSTSLYVLPFTDKRKYNKLNSIQRVALPAVIFSKFGFSSRIFNYS